MRQIVLDTETTGLEPEEGHRIIEIAGVELVERRLTDQELHYYLNPERDIDPGAVQVHGLTDDKLRDQPKFAAIAEEFIKFIEGSELIIHNAPFDEAFLNDELARLGRGKVSDHCRLLDTLAMARKRHPGRRNSLDALCQRYQIDASARVQHGALLDARLLANVYLAMTGGQASMAFASAEPAARAAAARRRDQAPVAASSPVVQASAAERAAHQALLERMCQESDTGSCVWQEMEAQPQAPSKSAPPQEAARPKV